MTPTETKRAAALLKTIADAEEWLGTIEEEGAKYEAFLFDDIYFGPFDGRGSLQGFGNGESRTAIEMPLAREMFAWLIERAWEELANLGVVRPSIDIGKTI